MSRGFVKEDDLEHAGTDLPERPLSLHPNYVTPLGLRQLQQQATELEQTRQQLAPRKEDPVVNQKLAVVERDLRYFQARLENAVLVDPAKQDGDNVLFGACVTVEDENGDTHEFRIVGEDEADPAKGSVSHVSPLARALVGKRVGDEATVAGQAVEIVALN